MNFVAISGRICNDVKSHNTIVSFLVAVDRRYKAEGKTTTDFIRCVAFGKTSDYINKYFCKGMKIALTGRIQTGVYEKDGTNHYITEVIAEYVECAERKADIEE